MRCRRNETPVKMVVLALALDAEVAEPANEVNAKIKLNRHRD